MRNTISLLALLTFEVGQFAASARVTRWRTGVALFKAKSRRGTTRTTKNKFDNKLSELLELFNQSRGRVSSLLLPKSCALISCNWKINRSVELPTPTPRTVHCKITSSPSAKPRQSNQSSWPGQRLARLRVKLGREGVERSAGKTKGVCKARAKLSCGAKMN